MANEEQERRDGAAKAHEPQDHLALHAQQGWLAKEMSAMAEREVVTTQLDWLEHELEHQKSGSSVRQNPPPNHVD